MSHFLTVIASSHATSVPANGWVLRLDGVAGPEEVLPPGVSALSERVSQTIRTHYPEWVWSWLRNTGALEITLWPGPISWWWYAPLSEMSPMRSPFFRHLYGLLVFRELLAAQAIEKVNWYGDNPTVASIAQTIAHQQGVPFHYHRVHSSFSNLWNRVKPLLLRLYSFASQLIVWVSLKTMMPFGESDFTTTSSHVFFTRFPVLWELRQTPAQERMLGEWPSYLASQGKTFFYAAVFTSSPFYLMTHWRQFRRHCRSQRIVFLETYLSLATLCRAHWPFPFISAYRHWKRKEVHKPLLFEGVDIRSLWWSEIDANIVTTELPFARTLAAAWTLLLKKAKAVTAVSHPFEFQPMERALWCGVKSNPSITVVGIQSGLFGTNQMGLAFLKKQMRTTRDQATHVPIPDYLAAYNTYFQKLFSERLGESRVCLSGPMRYAAPPTLINPGQFKQAHHLPENKTFFVAATPALREEAYPILDAATQLMAQDPTLFFLVKFHYHMPLDKELIDLSKKWGVHQRFRLFTSDLHALFQVASIMLTSGSATGIEAMRYGCMPLVYKPLGEMPCNPMLDIPESVFVWSSVEELRQAMDACLLKNEEYHHHRQNWPKAIRAQFSEPGMAPAERLFNFLKTENVL